MYLLIVKKEYTNTNYLRHHQCDDLPLFFKAIKKRQAKMFGKQWTPTMKTSAHHGHTYIIFRPSFTHPGHIH